MRSPVVAPVPWGAIWLAVAYPFPHGNRVPWLQGFPLDMSLSKFMTRFSLDSGGSPATFSRTQRRSRRRKPVDFPPFAFFRVFSGPKTISLICLDHWLEANATWHRHPADVLSPFIWQRWYKNTPGDMGVHEAVGKDPRLHIASAAGKLLECGVDKKKFAILLNRLKKQGDLSESEAILFARSFAMTPDERWLTHENFLKSHGLFTHSGRKAFGYR